MCGSDLRVRTPEGGACPGSRDERHDQAPLNRIDEIVPPGVTINVADNMWNVGTTALSAESRRR